MARVLHYVHLWQPRPDALHGGHRRRVGDLPLAESVPFAAIDFEPLLEGDAFVVSYGGEAPAISYVMATPVELWEAQDENGQVLFLEIVGLNGHKTLLSFD